MTLLQETFNILQQDKKERKQYEWQKPIRPEHEFSFIPFNIPENRQKNKQREYFSKALAFIDMYKYLRFSDGYTVLAISSKKQRLLSMFNKNHKRVSLFIDWLISIGLLAEYDENYQFCAYYDSDNHSKSYVYSYETEQQIKQYCKTNNINMYNIKNYVINNSGKLRSDNNNLFSFEKEAVRFNSKVNFLKPDNWSEYQFEQYLTQCLYENYPQLKKYQELADYINETYYKENPELQISFVPKFTWRKGNKCVTKIGIRATNELVSAKKEYNDKDQEWTLHKDQIFNKYGLKEHYDVKSSVPRLTYLLNKGIWLDNNIDLYETMYNDFIHLCPSEKLEWNNETRKMFKSFHMRGYFDTENKISGHIKREISLRQEYNKDSWSDLDYVMKSYKKCIENTLGDLYDSEIFFHESCIYMDVLLELLKRDVQVWQVYDEWNTDKEISDIYDIIEQNALSYYNQYIKDKQQTLYFNKQYKDKYKDNNNINNSGKLHNDIKNEDTGIKSYIQSGLDLLQDFWDSKNKTSIYYNNENKEGEDNGKHNKEISDIYDIIEQKCSLVL